MSAELARLFLPRQDPAEGNGNNNGGAGGGDNNAGNNNGGGDNNNAGNGGNNNAGNGGNQGGEAGNGGNNNAGGDGNNNNNAGNGGNNNNNNAGNGGDNNAGNGGNNNAGNGNNNGGNNANASNRPSASVSGNSTSTRISIPQTAAPGGLTMLQPASKQGTSSYYPIAPSQYITFQWNLTSLYVQPTSLTVVAYCDQNGNTYPVGPTGGTSNTIPGNQSQIVWNPYEWSTMPGQPVFAMASYTLKVWDERGEDARVTGGYLSPFSGTQFGMYIPRAYTPLAEWTCPTCSGALALQPAGLSILTSLFIVLITAWGLLRRH